MTYEAAHKKAKGDLRKLSPYVAANAAGVVFDGREFRVPFFDRVFAILFPEGDFREIGGTGVGETRETVPTWLQIVLLHYLTNASGAQLADLWITFRQLPGGYVYEKAFAEQAMYPLEQAFGMNLAGFVKAAERLGGVKMDRTGDAAFWFMAFPRVRLGCVVFAADEEMPASVNLLFDGAAGAYLPTEDLAVVGSYLSSALMGKGGAKR